MIIGISGKARSGKDQFGEYLASAFDKKYGRFFVRMGFADQLKTLCAYQFGLKRDQLYGDKKEVEDKRFPRRPTIISDDGGFKCGTIMEPICCWTPREIMQEVGSFYRKINYDHWVQTLDRWIKEQGYKNVLITDVRHLNECAYVRSNEGVLIRVVREEQKIHGMQHESETALDGFTDFDIEINNDGTLEDLYEAAENAADAILILETLSIQGGNYDGKS
jgi:hypothetical protein